MPIGRFLYRFMKQKTGISPIPALPTSRQSRTIPSFTASPPSPIFLLPPETHKNRKTVYASSRKRMEAEEVLVLKK